MAMKRSKRGGGGDAPKPNPSVVGVSIKRLREERGWTQHGLADRAGVKQGVIGQLETGATQYPGGDLLRRLALAFDVAMEDFWPASAMPSVEASLQLFVKSGLGGIITTGEMRLLRGARVLFQEPSLRAWMHALDAIRAANKTRKGEHT